MSKRTESKRRAARKRPSFGKKKAEPTEMKLEPGDLAVLRDFQLSIQHLNESMGRYLGYIGVAKHGLTEGNAYQFNPNWEAGVVAIKALPKPPAGQPPVPEAQPAPVPAEPTLEK